MYDPLLEPTKEMERELNNLKQKVNEYLSYSSIDEKIERQELRKQLAELAK